MSENKFILALCGGVGGAKLVTGLAAILPMQQLKTVINTGDDFIHQGLYISPDLDSVMYSLTGCSNTKQGWGQENESWNVHNQLEKIGGETWFKLGDKDIATSMVRTQELARGASLSEVTRNITSAFGSSYELIPMSDEMSSTMINTVLLGKINFQDYFVKHQCQPVINGIDYKSIENKQPQENFKQALENPALAAVIICPSNPYLSIEPILSLPGIRDKIKHLNIPVIVVSPIIAKKSIKGPTQKIMTELAIELSASSIANHYKDIASHIVIDLADELLTTQIEKMGFEVITTCTLMNTFEEKYQLAEDIIKHCQLDNISA